MKYTTLIFSMAFLLIIASCNNNSETKYSEDANSNTKKVETILTENQDSQIKLNYSGAVEPSLAVPLSFQLPGNIVKINVDEGDYVKKGQVLAEIDKTSYLSAYEASLAMQQQANDAYERLKKVYDNGSLPEIKWVDIKTKLEQANSSATIAKQNLSNCILRAPSPGIIGKKDIEVGENTIPGIEVMQIVTINPVYIKIAVPENEINRIKDGMIANIQIPAIGNKSFQGRVINVGVMANQVSKTYTVKIELPNHNQAIKPGMVCDVNLTINVPIENQTVVVPIQSILEEVDGTKYVFVVNNQSNKVNKVTIETGKIMQDKVQVLKGLPIGKMVVINGQHKLKEQQTVTITN